MLKRMGWPSVYWDTGSPMSVVAVVLVFLALRGEASYQNGTTMDTELFQELVDHSEGVLVKFDTKDLKEEAQQEFMKVVSAGFSQDNFIVMEVTTGNQKKKKGIAKYLGTRTWDFPVYMLFVKFRKEPITYKGDKENAVEIMNFIKKNTGIWLTNEGCLEAFDRLSLKFLNAPPRKRSEVLAEAEVVAAKQKGSNEKSAATIYTKVMKRYIKEGFDFIPREQKRVYALLDTKLRKWKQSVLTTYLHVLRFFENHKKPDYMKDEL